MDIRLAQRIAWGNKRAKGFSTTGDPLEFCSLSKEVAEAFDVLHKDRAAVSEDLADVVIFLMALAEMVGTDLQEAVEAKLAVSDAAESGPLPNGEQVSDPVAASMGHGKLVRDKIPQIIRSRGEEPVIHTATAEEYNIRLRDKLREEVDEFLASDNDPEELADILEVLHALARQAGIDQQQLEKLREAKAEKRGRFADRIIWSGNHAVAVVQEVSVFTTCSTASTGLQK